MRNALMRRGVLCIALMLGALSLGGARGNQEGNGQQRPDTQIERGSARIADAIRQIRPDADAGCQDRKDNRHSDLCAQWKAADAARDAATASIIAAVLSALGTGLVGFTLIYSVRTSRRELRAYIHIKTAAVVKCADGGFQAQMPHAEERFVRIAFKNYGQTPAHKVWCEFRACTGPYPLKQTRQNPPVDESERSVADLAPGRDNNFELEVLHTGERHQELVTGVRAIYFWGTINYEDAFGKLHQTHVDLTSTGADYLAGRMRPLPTGNSAT